MQNRMNLLKREQTNQVSKQKRVQTSYITSRKYKIWKMPENPRWQQLLLCSKTPLFRLPRSIHNRMKSRYRRNINPRFKTKGIYVYIIKIKYILYNMWLILILTTYFRF